MFSRFANQVQGMAFAPYKTRLARSRGAAYAGEVLAAFLQGQERLYAVEDALSELQALFGAGAILPTKLVREGLGSPCEDHRANCFDKAMELVERQVRGDRAGEES